MHTGSGTATTASSMGLLRVQVCNYPTKDGVIAAVYPTVTMSAFKVLSSSSLGSYVVKQSIKVWVRSSERAVGICKFVGRCLSVGVSGIGCQTNSPGESWSSLWALGAPEAMPKF